MRPVTSCVVRVGSQEQQEKHQDLVWSLQPIFGLLRVVGIDLDVSSSRWTWRRCSFLVFSWCVLVFTLAANIVDHCWKSNGEERRTTRFWVELVRRNTTILSSLLTPSLLVVVTLLRWKPLWEKVHRMEQLMNLSVALLWRLRRIAMAATALVIFCVALVKNPIKSNH